MADPKYSDPAYIQYIHAMPEGPAKDYELGQLGSSGGGGGVDLTGSVDSTTNEDAHRRYVAAHPTPNVTTQGPAPTSSAADPSAASTPSGGGGFAGGGSALGAAATSGGGMPPGSDGSVGTALSGLQFAGQQPIAAPTSLAMDPTSLGRRNPPDSGAPLAGLKRLY